MKLMVKLLLVALALWSVSCSEDSVAPDPGPGEEELITTVRMTLTPAGGGAAVTVEGQDLDGEGGNDPVIGSLTLSDNTTYTGTIEFLNEQESPAEDITEEVRDEDQNHQVFYVVSGGVAGGPLTVAVTDTDSGNLPLGLTYNVVVAGGTGLSGTLQATLYHYDDAADKDGVTPSDESDVQIDIPVTIN